jgi:stage III sporulation protein AD
MGVLQIVAAGVIAAVLSLTVKTRVPAFALLIGLAAGIVILLGVLPLLSESIGVFSEFAQRAGANSSYLNIILKITGIAYISEFGAQICVDAGENAIASKIEMGGKALIMVASAPIFISLLNIITTLAP